LGRVAGKVAVVTGGARGLGEAACRLLAKEEARVVVADIDVDAGRAVAKSIGDAAHFAELDVADERQWVRVIDDVVERMGKLNIVVNNAGLVRLGTAEDETAEQFRLVQSVMTDGVFFGIKHGIRAMLMNEEPGSIINFSSIAAVVGNSPFFAYSAAKGAVLSMTRSAAIHCQQQGYPIRVNSILPGALKTPMGDDLLGMVAAYTARTGRTPQMGSPSGPGTEAFVAASGDSAVAGPSFGPGMGESDDAGQLVLYLASDDSKFVNGAEIRIDNCASIQPN
jgi:3(or 17)beta-hydroxysteroid dehydrogenase